MAGTFTFLGLHFIFSTKSRVPFLDHSIKDRLHKYLGGIIRELKGHPIEINSMPDHVHLYVHMPKDISISVFMQKLKANSSKWIHDTFPEKIKFSWQEGYGAFTVSPSIEAKVIEYIRHQEEHHRVKSFKEELVEFLKANKIEFDERYIWK